MKEIYDLILKIKYICHCTENRISSSCQISLSELNGIKVMEGERAITCSDFSKRINLSPSRASRIIDNLVGKGFLSRKVYEQDRRSTLIVLTKKGQKVRNKINQEQKKFEQLLTSELTKEDIELLKKGLNLLEKIMENKIKVHKENN